MLEVGISVLFRMWVGGCVGGGWAVGLNDNNAILNSVEVVVVVGIQGFLNRMIHGLLKLDLRFLFLVDILV